MAHPGSDRWIYDEFDESGEHLCLIIQCLPCDGCMKFSIRGSKLNINIEDSSQEIMIILGMHRGSTVVPFITYGSAEIFMDPTDKSCCSTIE
ncbi:MAG: hypothetical protein A2161_10555 [Candidatus Schekmanbacteria bacterium RBG_13_48_7]|uniref:Uncharacterized protein n=1 Tax=Candidatus Schekmanbacteria bacterium RBG_13_48_7 TaxID=1817878 RepID=A0A1F7RWY1_9BACT|nr:MAG: hypothetical protein A2161_10555 [Candidatus Schekmanbacteria bacterium RBG_13_48_7]